MNSRQVSRDQAAVIKAQVDPMRDYLQRLRKRMLERGFPQDDPLYRLVCEAQWAMAELCMDVANRSYGGGGSFDPPRPAEGPSSLERRREKKRTRERRS